MNKLPRIRVYKKEHPLADKEGRVARSRLILYEKLEGISGKCNWCSIELTWSTLCADHINGNTLEDTPNNLVGSCRGCNANRSNGTGYGRKQPKECKYCKKSFLPKYQKGQTYCSNKCSQMSRPKRGSKAFHGTRSRYVYGCRCIKCTIANTDSWRIYNKSRG